MAGIDCHGYLPTWRRLRDLNMEKWGRKTKLQIFPCGFFVFIFFKSNNHLRRKIRQGKISNARQSANNLITFLSFFTVHCPELSKN